MKEETAAIRQQVVARADNAQREFDGVKKEFKSVYEAMDGLEEDMRKEATDLIDALRADFFDEVNEEDVVRRKLECVEDLSGCSQRSLETFAIRFGEEWKHVRTQLNVDLRDGLRDCCSGAKLGYATTQLDLRERIIAIEPT